MAERRVGLARARVAAGYTQESLAEAMRVDWRTVRRWEAGVATPQPYRRATLATLLSCDLRQLEMLLDENSSTVLSPSEASPDSTIVESVRHTSRHLIGLDMLVGAHELTDFAIKAARAASRKLGQPHLGPNVERDLTAAVGEIFEVAGWIAFDAERQEESEKLNRHALALSSLAGDSGMEKLTKLNMSMQSTHVGRYGEAVSLAQSIIDSGASPRVHAMCSVREARALSKTGHSRAIKVLAEARSRFQEGVYTHDPAWAWWIDGCELDGHLAGAFLDLENPEAAASILSDIVETFNDSKQPMYRTSALRCMLLESLVSTRQWGEVENLLGYVEARLEEIGSTRALRSLFTTVHDISLARGEKIPSTVQDMANIVIGRLRGR